MDYPTRLSKEVSPFIKISIFLGLIALCWTLSLVSLRSSLPLFFGVQDPDSFLANINSQVNAPAILYILSINTLGLFLLPCMFYFLIFNINAAKFLKLDHIPAAKFWWAGIVTMLSAGIFIQLFVQIESYIKLPAQYAYLRHQDKVVETLIDSLFMVPTFGKLLIVGLIVALLPAMAEELFFRGIIQNYLAKTNLGIIGAVICSGLSFSLMHGEFDNFLAIWCMGIVLGLLYYYSGSLWVNVAAHFVNNFVIVGMKYLVHVNAMKTDVTDTDILPLYYTLPAGVLMVIGLMVLRAWHQKSGSATPDSYQDAPCKEHEAAGQL